MARINRKLGTTPLDEEFQKGKAEETTERIWPTAESTQSLEKRTYQEERSEPNKPKTKFSTTKIQDNFSSLYLQLNIDNLSKYLGRGLFYPIAWEEEAIYLENRKTRVDVLSYFPNHLVLAPGIIGHFKENEILVELLLTTSEKEQLEPKGDAFLLNFALPISRIKSLIFASKNAQEKHLASRAVFEDSFFPAKLVEQSGEQVKSLVKLPSLPESLLSNAEASKVSIPHDSINYFDRVMGMFGFMKNVSLLRANFSQSVSDMTAGFLTAFCLINTSIELPRPMGTSIFKSILGLDEDMHPSLASSPRQLLFAAIIKRIFSGEEFNYQWAYEQTVNIPSLIDFAPIFLELSQEGSLSYNAAVKHIRGMAERGRPDQNLPLITLVFLCRFGHRDRSHTDKQSVRIHFSKDNFSSEYETTILTAILGLYYGYQNLVRDDKNLDIKDPVFSMVSPVINRIKFKIEKLIDRALVESIFQFSFFGHKPINDSFSLFKKCFDDVPRIPSLPVGYSSHNTLIQGSPSLTVSISIWTPVIKTLPNRVPLEHSIFQILSFVGATMAKEDLALILESLPRDKQTAAMDILRINLANKSL